MALGRWLVHQPWTEVNTYASKIHTVVCSKHTHTRHTHTYIHTQTHTQPFLYNYHTCTVTYYITLQCGIWCWWRIKHISRGHLWTRDSSAIHQLWTPRSLLGWCGMLCSYVTIKMVMCYKHIYSSVVTSWPDVMTNQSLVIKYNAPTDGNGPPSGK